MLQALLVLLNAGLLLVGVLLLERNWAGQGDTADLLLAIILIVSPSTALGLLAKAG